MKRIFKEKAKKWPTTKPMAQPPGLAKPKKGSSHHQEWPQEFNWKPPPINNKKRD